MKLLPVCLLALLLSACASFTSPNAVSELEPTSAGLTASALSEATSPDTAPPDIFPSVSYERPPKDAWERVIRNFQLDHPQHARVDKHRQWYVRYPNHLRKVSDRANRYLFHIIDEVERRGIPGELALLPIVESAFDPFAYSHGRASGVWQFIPSTGRAYGLQQDWWHDERRDIRDATRAALDYLEYLAGRFDGDWMLALASYNSGAGTVRRAIRKNRKAGKDTDFWSLDLPKETRDYVPKLMALAYLLEHADEFDVDWKTIPNEPYFAAVDTHGQIDLAQVAALADCEVDEIYRLNPQYNRWATHPDGPHQVLVPIEKAEQFAAALAALPDEQRVQWQRHQVTNGDSLLSLARRYQTTADVIRSVNELNGNTIYAGQTLLIPSAREGGSEYSLSVSQRLIKRQQATKPKRSQKVEYQVQQGDSFWTIARKHDTTVSKLTRWNSMAPGDPLQIGQTLTIWSQVPKSSGREVVRKVNYEVRKGDSLSSIGSRFKVAVRDIQRWNASRLRAKYLKPGQLLTLYVDVTR